MHAREAGRRNTDDSEIETTEANLSADHGGIGSELVGPRLVSKHDDSVSSRYLIPVGTERAAQGGPQFEHVEEVAGHREPELALSGLVSPVGEAREHGAVGCQASKALSVIAQIHVVGI